MQYRITVRSNPKVLLIGLVILGLPGIGVAAFFLWTPVAGVILTLIGGFFSYNFFKLVRSILSSRIETHDDAVVFDFGKGHRDEFRWDQITHAGLWSDGEKQRSIFVYDEEEDRLVTVPSEYQGFDDLVEEIRFGVEEQSGGVFEVIELGTRETIHDYLKSLVAPESESDD